MHSLSSFLQKIEQYAQDNPFPAEPKELYEPCAYILGLGGKRLRPALVLMGYALYKDDVEQSLPAAWAVELFHNFSLIHDDIMDAAPLRRGQATVHVKWNTTTGILSGDVMLIYAYRFLAKNADTTVLHRLLNTFNRVATQVCEGQQYDVNFETRDRVETNEYIQMIEFKTSVLLGAALEIGGICAGCSVEDLEHLYQCGRNAGIAFQIQDDYLDTFGDPEKFGKQVGGDILQNKKTLLVIKTLEIASDQDKAALKTWMQPGTGGSNEKVTAVMDLFQKNGIPDLIQKEKQVFQEKAFHHLDAISVPSERKKLIRGFLEDLLVREH